MKRINITEKESFGVDVVSTSRNLVYIPGFAWTGALGDTPITGKYREPHLCRSISEFEEYFGKTAPRFKTDQHYPVYVENTTAGFSQNAIPGYTGTGTVPIWFKGETETNDFSSTVFGDADPSWIYAHELLNAGLPVVYERVNKGATYPLKAEEYKSTAAYTEQSIVWYSTTIDGIVYNAYFICHAATVAGNAPEFNGSGIPQTNTYWTPWCGYNIYKKTNNYKKGDIVGIVANNAVTYKEFTVAGNKMQSLETIPDFAATQTYAVGDFVTYDNAVYCCKVAGKHDWSTANWTDNTTPTVTPDNWTTSHAYGKNDVVKVTTTSTPSTTTYWRCKEAHTSASTGSIDESKFIKNFGDSIIINITTDTINDDTYYFDGSLTTPVLKKGVITNSGESTLATLSTQPTNVPLYDVTVTQFYNELCGNGNGTAIYSNYTENPLADMSLYQLAFFTTGGYPNFEYTSASGSVLANLMALLAKERGDVVALIDHTDNPERSFLSTDSVYAAINANSGLTADNGKYAAMVTPWAVYRSTYTNTEISTALMPGSFGYLKCYAATLPYNDQYLSIAGVNRGLISDIAYLNTNKTLTNTVAENMQKSESETGVSINPITYINNYGYCIWANNTLLAQTSTNKNYASLDLNLRNTCNEIKKAARAAAVHYMFEQNTSTLWLDFKDTISTTLLEIQAKNVISDYQLIQLVSTDKSKLACQIKVWPVKAVESFDINIVLTDTDVTVS